MQINIFDDLILKESAADIGHLFTHLLYCELQIQMLVEEIKHHRRLDIPSIINSSDE